MVESTNPADKPEQSEETQLTRVSKEEIEK